jgi:hypothetical protein
MASAIDPANYVRPPVVNVAAAVALGCGLIAACPAKAPSDVRKAAAGLRATVVGLQTEWGKTVGGQGPEDKRPFDLAVDNAWAAVSGRLESYGWLPAEHNADAVRARELRQILFPSGLAFLMLPYDEEWAESEKLLRRIDDAADPLCADIDRLAGVEFLREVRRASLATPATPVPEVPPPR